MTVAHASSQISVEDYLDGEQTAEIKHDYVDGCVFAMAGASVRHNQIASNSLGSLHGSLRGKPCRPFNSDMKIRVRFPTHTRFYYPDVSVICRSNPDDDQFQDEPVVLVEVLSESTRRTDQSEKKDAYLTIPSLDVYIMLEQDTVAAVVYRRTSSGFDREVYEGLDSVIALPEIDAQLDMLEVYEGIS